MNIKRALEALDVSAENCKSIYPSYIELRFILMQLSEPEEQTLAQKQAIGLGIKEEKECHFYLMKLGNGISVTSVEDPHCIKCGGYINFCKKDPIREVYQKYKNSDLRNAPKYQELIEAIKQHCEKR